MERPRRVAITDLDGVVFQKYSSLRHPIKNSTKSRLEAVEGAARGLATFRDIVGVDLVGLTRRPEWLRKGVTEADIERNGIPLGPDNITYGVLSENKAAIVLQNYVVAPGQLRNVSSMYLDRDFKAAVRPVPLIDDSGKTVLEGLSELVTRSYVDLRFIPYFILVQFGTSQGGIDKIVKSLQDENTRVDIHGSIYPSEQIHTLRIAGIGRKHHAGYADVHVVSMPTWDYAEAAAKAVRSIQDSLAT